MVGITRDVQRYFGGRVSTRSELMYKVHTSYVLMRQVPRYLG